MQEFIKIMLSVLILLTGFFIGNYLAKLTKEELKYGQIWFKRIIIISLVGSAISLILKNDSLLFSFLFISVVTSRSLKKKAVR